MKSMITNRPIKSMDDLFWELEGIQSVLEQLQRAVIETGTPESDRIVMPIGLIIRHFENTIKAGYRIKASEETKNRRRSKNDIDRKKQKPKYGDGR
ncbi:MAG: hypothetical protein LLH30_05065 [Candidatus Manganitrophus sp. SA1]|nr:hypothetical protein [Candidatus Manganitrophus morganii]